MEDGSTPTAGIGYFEAGSTRLCAVDQCPILSPRLAEIFAILRTLVASNKAFSALDEIEAFADAADEKLLHRSTPRNGSKIPPPVIADQLYAALCRRSNSILIREDRRADKFELFGPGYLTYSVRRVDFRVGHLSFFQVNRFMVDALIDGVLGDSRGRLALDLYAGVGLFTVPLTGRFDRVIGVESNLAAAKDLEVNLQSSGGASPTHHHSTTEDFLAHWRET